MMGKIARSIAQVLAASAPPGATGGVFRGGAAPSHCSVTGRYDGPVPRTEQGLLSHALFFILVELAEVARADRGWEAIGWEAEYRSCGTYRLVVFSDAVLPTSDSGGAFVIVLDPDRRVPQSGLRQAAGTAAPAGDPAAAVSLFRRCLDRRAAVLGRPVELPPPATPAALDDAERRIGRPLPADLRALYLVADGDVIGYQHHHLLGGLGWLPLEQLVEAYLNDRALPHRAGRTWMLMWDAVTLDADPAGTVRRCEEHPGWIPFASGEDGNFLAVDTAPAHNGRPGQVIRKGSDYYDAPEYAADSLTSLLRADLELLEQGRFEVTDGDLYLLHPDAEPQDRSLTGPLPAEVPPALQDFSLLSDDAVVDLAPLRAAKRLRQLRVHRGVVRDLGPLRELPVESLQIDLEGGGLGPLAGHPHLAALTLGTAAPTDLAPLRTLPHLHGLDLSRARAADPAVLGEPAGLQYLALTARQWDTLLALEAVPPGLAAAQAADCGLLDDALALAARLGLDTRAAVRTTGTV